MNDYGKNIENARKNAGLTQQELAECAGISQAMMAHIEKGIREISADKLKIIADKLDCSIDKLLGRG